MRQGSYFLHWLLERRRVEQALVSVLVTACLLGVFTRRVGLAESLGATELPKSQAGVMGEHLDEQDAAFCDRLLDSGPYAFVWVDALTQKIREGRLDHQRPRRRPPPRGPRHRRHHRRGRRPLTCLPAGGTAV
ncbi:transposase [Streptomyces sp. AC627_RSS907]|uniref:transposase n=1 Tax=Streptomyces sp. AC627_RSS907 TaxID=2823684 RepID=UPI0020B8467C|nr:transposase [Streptomyces sp. AC627_RSS907]